VANMLIVVILGGGVIVLIGFALYLWFCHFVVDRTGDTSGLRDVAIAVRAFAFIGSLSPRPRSLPPPAAQVELDSMTPGQAGILASKTTVAAVQLASSPTSQRPPSGAEAEVTSLETEPITGPKIELPK
jgi:hypothetical protein